MNNAKAMPVSAPEEPIMNKDAVDNSIKPVPKVKPQLNNKNAHNK